MSRQKMLRHIGIYSAATYFNHFLSLVSGVVTRNLLGPAHMGIWTVTQVVLQYFSFVSVGTSLAISREVPYYLGKKDLSKAREIQNVVSTFQVSSAVVSGGLVLMFAWGAGYRFSAELHTAFYFLAGLIVLQRINNLMVGILRAYQQFDLISKQIVFSGLFNLSSIVALTYYWGLYGFMSAMVLSMLFNIIFLKKNHQFQFEWFFDRAKLAEVVRYSLPLMLFGLLEGVLRSADKIILVKLKNFEIVGYYSLAMLFANFFGNIPTALGTILLPHFQAKYGKRDRVSDIRKLIHKASSAFMVVIPIFIGIVWIFMPYVVALLMPKYAPGVQAARYLILSSFFISLQLNFTNVILTLKKTRVIIVGLLVLIGINAGANWTAIYYGGSIDCVALIASATAGLYFIFTFIIAGKLLKFRKKMFYWYWRHGVGSFLRLIVSIGVIQCILDYVHWSLFVELVTAIIIFMAIQMPAVISLQKKLQILIPLNFLNFKKQKDHV